MKFINQWLRTKCLDREFNTVVTKILAVLSDPEEIRPGTDQALEYAIDYLKNN